MNTSKDAPYRATRLWNEVVLAFRTGMPLRKHRRHMLQFENCFTASEAVTWLNCYLKNNSNFGAEVTRQQTVQLLQKFLRCGVIEDMRSLKNGKKEFQDNTHLYKFMYYSPLKSKKSPLQVLLRTPLSTRNECPNLLTQKKANIVDRKRTSDSENIPLRCNEKKQYFNTSKKDANADLPECHIISRTLSVTEVENIWKTIILTRLKTVLNIPKLDDFINVSDVSGRIIMHNMNRISKNGVVILTDKTDDLPHWVISAMKCLANWPYASGSGSCLPNYPGFEIDVFRVVKDYFINLDMLLSPLDFSCLIKMIKQTNHMKDDCGSMHPSHKTLPDQSGVSCGPVQDWINHISVQNCGAMLPEQKTSTPLYQYPGVNGFKSEVNCSLGIKKNKSTNCSSELLNAGKMILDDPNTMWEFPLSMCYETAFTNASPITRIVPHHPAMCLHGSQSSLHTLSSQATELADTVSTISACSHVGPNLCTKQISCSGNQLLQTCSFSELQHLEMQNQKHPLPNLDFAYRSVSMNNLVHSNPIDQYSYTDSVCAVSTLPRKDKSNGGSLIENKGFGSMRRMKREHEQRREELVKNVQLADKNKSLLEDSRITEHDNQILLQQNSTRTCSYKISKWKDTSVLNRSYSFNSSKLNDNKVINPSSKHSFCTIPTVNPYEMRNYEINDADCETRYFYGKPDLHNKLSEMLLVTTKSPRALTDEMKAHVSQVLQMCMLLLPPCNRRHLHLLLRMISKILKNNKLNLSSTMTTRNYLLSFLHSILCEETNCEEPNSIRIVTLLLDECENIFQPPSALREEVEARLSEMQRAKIRYTLDDSCTITYCEQVSVQQFQEQQICLSRKSLTDLLESIIQDMCMSQKEKKRKLKQFKENHPDVYAARFPTPATEDEVLKKQSKSTFLRRLLHLRT